MKKLREVENEVGEANNENTTIVYETKMNMARNHY
jgi:hypothetical protein